MRSAWQCSGSAAGLYCQHPGVDQGRPFDIPSHKAADAHGWPLWLASAVLVLAGLARRSSRIGLAAMEPAIRILHISERSPPGGGGDRGNAVENVCGIQLAPATSPITRFSVILNSSSRWRWR